MSMSLPRDYQPTMAVRDIETAIKSIKDFFETHLAAALSLQRVTAPLFVRAGTGVNDDLNGVEKPVSFTLGQDKDERAEIVQSLAKWKRLALKRYGFSSGEGLYTDMNAIRPDELLDNTHSIYVDQWDWEKIIQPEARSLDTLKETVEAIYTTICRTEFHLAARYPHLRPILPEKITFITAEELQLRYPDLDPRQREDAICKESQAVFIAGIGHDLADGRPHDGRAPDYDDWSTPRPDGGHGLNGDILLWHPVLGRALEISSMGIRVDPQTLMYQLTLRQALDRRERDFHRQLLAGELPQTMGGGIGQSRLCMFCLRTAHIGEVAVGLWPDDMVAECARANITLL